MQRPPHASCLSPHGNEDFPLPEVRGQRVAFATLEEGCPPEPQAETEREEAGEDPVRTVLSPWARDALGIGLIVLSLLAALSLWLEAGGPVGRGITWLIRGSFGVGAYAFPVLGAWWGFVLLRDIAREDRVRMAIGFAFLVAGVLGLVSLFMGNPSFSEGWSADGGLAEAGGAVGALTAWPLARVISPIGAAIVSAGLASLGLLIFTGTPFAAVREKIDTFREERDERDPVSARATEAERTKPRRRWSLREAFGLTDDVIQLPTSTTRTGPRPRRSRRSHRGRSSRRSPPSPRRAGLARGP